MRVLVADAFEESGLTGLVAAGCEVDYQPDLGGSQLAAVLESTRARVLVVRSTRVTSDMLERSNLALIVRAGAGVNTIDVAGATARRVHVSNCPGCNAVAVAELTLALILALDRRIPDNVADLRAGVWNKKKYARARGLYGRSLGLLGFGHVGQEVARRAHAFGMTVLVWSPRFERGTAVETGLDIEIAHSPESVAEQCEILSLHLALTASTTEFVGASILGRLRRGAYFVNTARAELVDTVALQEAILDRDLRVALDVPPAEPAEGVAAYVHPLFSLPNVYGTHHIGASTQQAQEAIARETVRIVRTFLDTGAVLNAVNAIAPGADGRRERVEGR